MEVKSFKCDLCQKTFSGEKDTLSHFEGRKHLKLAEQKNDVKCGVFIAGFSYNQTKEDALQYFSNYGGIKKSIVGPTMSYMIIVYENEEEAAKVLRKDHFLGGRKLRVAKRQAPQNVESNENDEKIHEYLVQSLKNITNLDDQINKFVYLMTPDLQRIPETYHLVNQDIVGALSVHFSRYYIYNFGSSTTFLQLHSSDLDIYLDILDKPANDKICLKMIRSALTRSKLFHSVIDIPSAKIPIVRGVHSGTGMKFDINFKNFLGVENSKLIRFYLSLDNRLRSIMLVLKYWAKIQEISGRNHLFTSYSMVMMFIFYLQQCYEFPSVYQLQKYTNPTNPRIIWNMNINHTDDIKETIRFAKTIDILKGFFHFYSTFNFDSNIICPYLGETVEKHCFSEVGTVPKEFRCYLNNLNSIEPLKYDKPVCLQDPFEHNVNTCSIIFKNILERYITACSAALGILSQKEEDILVSLFSVPKNVVQTTKKKKKDEDPNTYSICLKKPKDLKYLKPCPESELSEKWFQHTMDYCGAIFERVLKLELTEIHKNKSARVGTQQHANDNVKMFHAVSYVNLWDSRIINSESIKTKMSNCKNTMEKDIVISDHIWKENSKIRSTVPLFKCNITLTCQNDPPSVNIEILRLNSYKKMFKSFALYVSSKIPSWFIVHVKELNEKESPDEIIVLD